MGNLSFGTLSQLRIKDETQLTPDDLVAGNMVDAWIRVRLSSTSHRLGPDLRTARCGFPLDLWPDWWENTVRHWFKDVTGKDPGDWFMVEETRKDGKCKACKNQWALTDAKYDESRALTTYLEDMTGSTARDRSPAQDREYQKFITKVAWVAGELGGEII